jgi:hypothetical protein
MERIPSKLYRFFALLLHIYYCFMIFQIWGFKIKTFLFLTKINFFFNLYLFSYLSLNSHYKFDQRPEKYEKDEKKNIEKKYYLYTRREMTLIKISFAFSIGVNVLYWLIMLLKRDFMGDTDTPAYVELFLHGGNTMVVLLECFFNRKSVHNDTAVKSIHVIIFAFLYITLKYFVYYTMDVQIYPMISKLSVPLYYCLGLFGYLLYLLSCLIFKMLFL